MSKTDLSAWWMPFTANRQFKASPMLLERAEGMHYFTPDGRPVLDGAAGLWCVNAGHGRREIVEAVSNAIGVLDYAPPFKLGHPLAFRAAEALRSILPPSFSNVFFANSGSEAAETALKIARAYHVARGEPGRVWLIGRERAYHGVNFGGLSVGGIPHNQAAFGPLLREVDHLRHTHDPQRNAFSRGQPQHGAEFADDLLRIISEHGAQNIAAVIVEPMAGSTGVLLPPKDYLERLRSICTEHGILLIFDEVITGFGRLGAPFAAQRFGVLPDMIAMAKGMTNGTIPMGGVAVQSNIYDSLMQGPVETIELFHGYTYSGHPAASAALIATLQIYEREQLFQRARDLEPYWEDAVHMLRQAPNVVDVRNMGLVGGIELAPLEGRPGARGSDVYRRAFEAGLLVRVTSDTIALSPPLIISQAQIDEVAEKLSDAIAESSRELR
ncbi:MAG TPA: aspartate aminotransferase family protein [Sphingomicrobium sp.]|jgi:beta-alanine--pyruvate transaminase|nr:aspartate aminotransferase family protein [Sphingomicrobium sp.]